MLEAGGGGGGGGGEKRRGKKKGAFAGAEKGGRVGEIYMLFDACDIDIWLLKALTGHILLLNIVFFNLNCIH